LSQHPGLTRREIHHSIRNGDVDGAVGEGDRFHGARQELAAIIYTSCLSVGASPLEHDLERVEPDHFTRGPYLRRRQDAVDATPATNVQHGLADAQARIADRVADA